MTDAAERLATKLEIAKLSHELDVSPSELGFLADQSAEAIRAFRKDISASLFGRHEQRFQRVATLSGMVPSSVSARAAQLALGPTVSARVAGALTPAEAVKLADKLPADFVADLALSLDPVRAEAIVRRVDATLIIAVGKILLERGEHLVLGRFVSVVEPAVALRLVADAPPSTLLEIALLADDRSVLSELVAGLTEAQLTGVLEHCHTAQTQIDALTLLTALDVPARTKVIGILGDRSDDVVTGFLDAVQEVGAWPEVVPALAPVGEDKLRRLVNVDATLDTELFDDVVRTTRDLDQGPLLVRLLLVFDDAHVEILRGSKVLRDPEMRDWIRDHAGVAKGLSDALLDGLGLTRDDVS